MEDQIIYIVDDSSLGEKEFLRLVMTVWPGTYDIQKLQLALESTINFTAWDGEALVGCARLLTDGYFFSTVSEILVLPDYQRKGIGSKLMEKAFEASPSTLSFGVQPQNEAFFEKLGYQKIMGFFQKRKNRNP
ncbi:MAG: GNAT family N-acetyltransferase [Bacteroidota bacterium]